MNNIVWPNLSFEWTLSCSTRSFTTAYDSGVQPSLFFVIAQVGFGVGFSEYTV